MATMITAEQRVEKAIDLLIQSPPGEIKEVLGDLKSLLKEDSVFKNRSLEAVRRLYEDALTPVTLSSSSKPSLVTKYGRISDGKYVDHANKITFLFDYKNGVASKSESLDEAPVWEAMRKSLSEAVETYVSGFYKSGNSTVYGLNRKGSDVAIVCIESHIHKPSSFWNGQFNTVYKVKKVGGSLELKGKISSVIHYYEDGNVQMISKKKVGCTINSTDVPGATKELISNIRGFETEYQTLLLKQMGEMMEGTFKALRRALPVTRSKVDWAKISAYRVGNDATKK